MLGKSERESAVHARAAAAKGGWDNGDSVLLELGSRTSMLATIAALDAINGVVHIGHPSQPDPGLERRLLSADNSLVLTQSVSIDSQWTLVGRSHESNGTAIIDEAGMRDTRQVLRTLGITPQVVSTTMSVDDRCTLAGEHGMLVLEKAAIPAGYFELEGASLFASVPPLWYGLLETAEELYDFTERTQIWLAFGPTEDHEGSLRITLNVFAEHSIDLQHLRSQRAANGTHVFLSSFAIADSTVLRSLLAQLSAQEVQYRILAILPGTQFIPGPDALTPVWSNMSQSAIAAASSKAN
jgi:hypothetical protein